MHRLVEENVKFWNKLARTNELITLVQQQAAAFLKLWKERKVEIKEENRQGY